MAEHCFRSHCRHWFCLLVGINASSYFRQNVAIRCHFDYGAISDFQYRSAFSQCEHSKIKQFLVYVGNYTFIVLTWHFLSMKLVSFMLIAIYGLPMKRLSEFPVIEEYARQGWWIAYLVVGVAVPVIWTYYYHLFKDRLMNCSANKSLS